MAKSSSSSKSSKSSKSMGIDLTMVLLAVLVGLIVCSLMNNKPLIEGARLSDPIPSSGPGSGVCRGRTGSQDPICLADPSANTEQTCGGDQDVTGGVCTWQGYNSTYSYSGGLDGSIYDIWMKSLGIRELNGDIPASAGAQPTAFKETSIIPVNIKGRGATVGVDPDAVPTTIREDSNFLEYIHVTRAADVENNPYIPNSLESEVRRQVLACESGWDQDGYKDSYNLNGGRAIMGYNQSEGLVCRNPLYYPIKLQGSEPRIWLGQQLEAPNNLGGCPSPTADAGGCNKRTASCGWENSKTYAGAISSGLYNNLPFSSGGACGLDSCAAQYPQQCAKNTLMSGARDGIGWAINNIIPRTPELF